MAVPVSKAKFRGLGKTQMATRPEWDDHMSATVEGVKLTLRDQPGGGLRAGLVLCAHVRGSPRGCIGEGTAGTVEMGNTGAHAGAPDVECDAR